MAKVKKIEATISPIVKENRKIKVAAYARVSTDHEEQDGSFETQIDYYKNKINNNPEWKLVKVYADKGASGTCIEGRHEFKEMIKEARKGKIDLILCKSISRFARNTITTLETIRELKEKGVAVEFEKEGLRTDTNQGELMLTILSALAEQESKSISENIQWGIKAKFKEGKDVHNFYRFLGYTKGWIIVEEEAKTIRKIYRKYLEGKSMSEICKELEKEGRKRHDGGTKWHVGSISYILNNPAYCGDIILQKSITIDYRGRIRKKNEGEEPMYYVENHHPAIISKKQYDRVQLELKRRKRHKAKSFNVSPFFGTVFTTALSSNTIPFTEEVKQNNQSITKLNNLSNSKAELKNIELQKKERKTYRRITIHSNVEKWKKVIWKPQKIKNKSHIDNSYNNTEIIIYPTLPEEELYHIFEKSLIKLVEREKEVKGKINQYKKEVEIKIPQIENQRKQLLNNLKKKLNRIAIEIDEDNYTEMVINYNKEREEYERLGDEIYTIEHRNKQGQKINDYWQQIIKITTIQKNQLCKENFEKNKYRNNRLNQIYRDLNCEMEVMMNKVFVDLGAGIVIEIDIEKYGKSWRMK